MEICVTEGCNRRQFARGICSAEYFRARRKGNLDEVALAPKPRGPRKEVVGYKQAHRRVTNERGPARLYFCAYCDGEHRASTWALNHDAPAQRIYVEQFSDYTLEYSLDTGDYLPMCHKGHSAYDRNWRESKDVA